MSENVVEINGKNYRYRYNLDTQKTEYLGPVGDNPSITEEEFFEHYWPEEVAAIKQDPRFGYEKWRKRVSNEYRQYGTRDHMPENLFHAFMTDVGKEAGQQFGQSWGARENVSNISDVRGIEGNPVGPERTARKDILAYKKEIHEDFKKDRAEKRRKAREAEKD
jgi:hypothetical protein